MIVKRYYFVVNSTLISDNNPILNETSIKNTGIHILLKINCHEFVIRNTYIKQSKAQKRESNSIIATEAELTLVANGFEFIEGPAVDKLGNIYFTDQLNDRIIKWNAMDNTVSDYMKPSGRSNGLYFDSEWNLLAAADEKNELWHIDSDKKVTVLINDFDGKKLTISIFQINPKLYKGWNYSFFKVLLWSSLTPFYLFIIASLSIVYLKLTCIM